MRIYADGITAAIIGLSVGAVVLIALFILLYIFVFSRSSIKKQVRELERRYSYLDALLLGQDSQYIHRLEIISHTNLLYVEKYGEFSKRFKEIFDNDDKFSESMIKQLNSLIANKQYKNIKLVIADARHTIDAFEEAVNELDKDLYEVIRPEEEARQAVLKIKENYRRVKQIFYSNSNDLELVSSSFTKVFDRLDQSFIDFESHIESAEYDEANALLPTLDHVVNALSDALEELPSLCILIENVIPEKISSLEQEYIEVEKKGVPLFNLSFHKKVDRWNSSLTNVRERTVDLNTVGCKDDLNIIANEIEEVKQLLNSEVVDKDLFEKESGELYTKVIELEKNFLKICSLLPEVEEVYVKKGITLASDCYILNNFVYNNENEEYVIYKK